MTDTKQENEEKQEEITSEKVVVDNVKEEEAKSETETKKQEEKSASKVEKRIVNSFVFLRNKRFPSTLTVPFFRCTCNCAENLRPLASFPCKIIFLPFALTTLKIRLLYSVTTLFFLRRITS